MTMPSDQKLILFVVFVTAFVLAAWLYNKITATTDKNSFHRKMQPLMAWLAGFEVFGIIVSMLHISDIIDTSAMLLIFFKFVIAAMWVSGALLFSTVFNRQCRKQIARPFQSRAAKLIFAAVVLLATVFGSAISAIFKAMIYLFAAGAGGGSSSSGGFFNEEKSYKNKFGMDTHTHYADLSHPKSADWD